MFDVRFGSGYAGLGCLVETWRNHPIPAMLEGVSAAFSGALGFVAALVAGIGVGFAGHGARLADTHDGFFLLYLFLSLGLYVFQAIGLTAKAGIADQAWLRLGGIGLGVAAIFVAGKTLVACWRR